MKLIKTVKLYFTQGTSDKVYEVDLCENQSLEADRYWVNFRYGRRGATLREGTKTPAPVDFTQAEAIFNSVVVAKTNKGYREINFHTSSPDIVFSSSLQALLRDIDSIRESEKRARCIWRLPQYPDAMLADWLEKGLNAQHHWLENYARLWTLGRVGGQRNLARVMPFLTAESQPLSQLAYEVWLRLADKDDSQAEKEQQLATLPAAWGQALADGDNAAIDALFQQHICAHNPHASAQLKTLYLLALDSELLHQSLLRALSDMPLRPNLFKGIRYLFKMAEFRFDAPMFALLAWRFDTTREFFAAEWDGIWLEDTGYIKPSTELLRADSRLAYSRKTRDYLRRRSWRALRRLGAREDRRYVDMACAILLQYRETGLVAKRNAYSGSYASDAHLFAWNAILRSHHPLYQRHRSRALWIKVDAETDDDIRGEAFPHLWDQHPEALLTLLLRSDSEVVCAFALRAIKENTSFCRALTDTQLAQLLLRPLPAIAEYTLSLLTGRSLSAELLLALIHSPWPPARTLALAQLNSFNALFDETELAAGLLLTDDEQIRNWLNGRFIQQPLTRLQQEALGQALLRQLSIAQTSFSEQHAQWLSVCFISHLNETASLLTLEALSALLDHKDAGVQLLAAQLLVSSASTLASLPDSLITKIHGSPVAAVRAAGIALLGKQSMDTLLLQLPQLIDFLNHGEAAEQQASYGLLGRLAKFNAASVFDGLFPLLFQKEAQEGGHQALLMFITQALSSSLNQLDKDTLWRMIHAKSLAAQKLGAELLTTRLPLELSVKQWVVLANHPDHLIRDYGLTAFTSHPQAALAQSAASLALLESDWPATREFGFAFFRQHYSAQVWTPELIVTLCDSQREDVQEYGRELLQTFFQREQGEEYLLKLSQHPAVTVQRFVTHFFEEYAGGKPDVILALKPCFLAILSQVNRGRIAKDRTLQFLTQQASVSPQVLEMVAALLTRLSLTVVQKDKAPLIKAMLQLQQRYPQLNLPLEIIARPGQGASHAG